MYAFKQIAENKLDPNYAVDVDVKNVVPTESVNDGLPIIEAENTITVDRLIRQMITQSDNTAFNVLLDILDRRAVTQYVQSLGLSNSAVGSKLNLDTSQTQYEFDIPGYGINTTTAEDYTAAFTLILKNQIPNAKQLLEILKQQKINYMLPLYLPKNVVTAHKHGDLDPLYHDGGIVFDDKSSYVVSIFSNAGSPNLVAHLSELIYTKNPKLVGSPIQNPTPLSEASPPIDPLVARGQRLPSVLGAQNPPVQKVTITAADLGITAKDLSLAQPAAQLPKVIIPADSQWHFLVSAVEFLRKANLNDKIRIMASIDIMSLKVAEAKDLALRHKQQEANTILQKVQQEMNSIVKNKAIQKDAQAQIALQSISETRFQILGDSLKEASETNRNELIHEIGQQAKNTLSSVQPNLPLANNATNLNQKPLIGEVVSKNDSSIIVKTAGGQEMTIPTTGQSIAVKVKESVQPNLTLNGASPTPTPKEKPSLSSLEVGTTVALVGSSVGNTFTPTFVLAKIPQELAAPIPVTVIKTNQRNHTMVISENGVPVQVNITNKTAIKSSDTNVKFSEIKPGDVIIVHGQPLTQVKKDVPASQTPNPLTPTALPKKLTPSTPVSPSNRTTIAPQNQQGQSSSLPNTPAAKQNVTTPSQPSAPNQQQNSQPKVIESNSIKIIEKKEDIPPPPPAQNQKINDVKREEKSQPQTAPQEEPKNQPAKTLPARPQIKTNEKKK